MAVVAEVRVDLPSLVVMASRLLGVALGGHALTLSERAVPTCLRRELFRFGFGPTGLCGLLVGGSACPFGIDRTVPGLLA